MSLSVLPRIIRKNPYASWSALYSIDKHLVQYRDQKGYVKGRLVDIGCGSKPYKKFWAKVVTEHIGIDHTETLHDKTAIDRLGSAYAKRSMAVLS